MRGHTDRLPRLASFSSSGRRFLSSGGPTEARSDLQPPQLDFADSSTAFAGIPTSGLVRGAAVFTLCQWPFLVNNAEALLAFGKRIFGNTVVSWVVRPTFFAHFCAGEDEESIKPTIDYLERNGICPILDYAAEPDVDGGGGPPAQPPQAATNHRYGVDSARVYDYTTELECDQNAAIFKKAIQSVKNVSPSGFAAIKITALGNPLLLERWSTAILEIQRLFRRIGKADDNALTWTEFHSGCRSIFKGDSLPDSRLRELFDQFDSQNSGVVDPIEWTTVFGPELMALVATECLSDGPFAHALLDAEEVELVTTTLKRADRLAALASELGVRIMIDAEHSFMQPAIDQIVLGLQRKYNAGSEATVYNTIQCYLKEAPGKLAEHIARSDREQWHFACKIVRGAYMVLERERASKLGYPDPIHATIEDTHRCYDDAAKTILQRAAVQDGRSEANLMAATHNQQSIERLVSMMSRLGIDRATGRVAFGQLLGMSDHLSFTLGKAGYLAFKYVPYGPEDEVMPYLVRRVQENSSMLSGAGAERSLILSELHRRVFGT